MHSTVVLHRGQALQGVWCLWPCSLSIDDPRGSLYTHIVSLQRKKGRPGSQRRTSFSDTSVSFLSPVLAVSQGWA